MKSPAKTGLPPSGLPLGIARGIHGDPAIRSVKLPAGLVAVHAFGGEPPGTQLICRDGWHRRHLRRL